MAGFRLKRIYEEFSEADGYRILVDRLWPRGVKKEAAKLDEWDKELAPSTEIRKAFNHQPERFEAFSTQYREELSTKQTELDRLRAIAKRKTVTLVYAAKDQRFNQATVLKDVLES